MVRRDQATFLRSVALLGTGIILLAACQQGADPLSSSGLEILPSNQSTSVSDPDEFLVVDCLLTAPIKRLGRQLTIPGKRRLIRTSGVDCGIRGGEYVSYDRSDYKTALAVWTETARATDDPVAQTYLGQIYERGLTGAPDYGQAVSWYRKAAEQGHDAALINLGQLYEQGLGVERDPLQALNFYRQASDLDGVDMTYLVSSDVASELETLRDQVVVKTEAADDLRRQIGDLEQQLADLAEQRAAAVGGPLVPYDEWQQRQEAFDAERATLAEERRRLDDSKSAVVAERDVLEEMRRKIDEGLTGVLGRETELSRRELELRKRDDELTAKAKALELQAQDLARKERVLEERSRAELTPQADQRQTAGQSSGEQPLDELDKQIDAVKEKLAAYSERLLKMAGREFSLPAPEITILPNGPLEPGARLKGTVLAPGELVSLSIDDRMMPFEPSAKPALYGFDTSLPLVGTSRNVRLLARDKQGKVGEQVLDVGGEQHADPGNVARTLASIEALDPSIELGTFHALVIGNAEFDNLPELPTARADAEAVAAVLQQRYGFSVRTLRNASRFDILAAINDHRIGLNEDHNYLLYYAGHCKIDEQTKQGHWLPTDASASDPKTWISNAQITDIIDTMKARRVMVVADSCYSGVLSLASVPNLSGTASDEELGNWLRSLSGKRSRTVLTSGRLAPQDVVSKFGRSAFANAFISALEENDGVMAGHGLFSSLSARVLQGPEQLRPDYAPIKYTGHEASDFFFVPNI